MKYLTNTPHLCNVLGTIEIEMEKKADKSKFENKVLF